MKFWNMISLTLPAVILDRTGFNIVSEGRASSAEHGNLSFDFFEQLHLASMVCIYELGTGNSAFGGKRINIWYFDHVSFLIASLTHFLFSNGKNFGCPGLLLPAEPRFVISLAVFTLPWR